MISVTEATRIIASHALDFGTEQIHLDHCSGKILRESIFADADMPPFDRVAMDGIAICYKTFEEGARIFPIVSMAAAGSPQQQLIAITACIEIMTGAILPVGADAIIPYEWITIENGNAIVNKENVLKGQNIHRRGTDKKKGDMLIQQGKLISSSEAGILASVGKITVTVSIQPKVLIVSTGDELIAINKQPLPHQLRMSNVFQLQHALRELKINADHIHLHDDFKLISESLQREFSHYQMIIISGGMSAGKFDHIPAVLDSLHVEKHFYKVRQKTGKPFFFGTHENGCVIFGVPGNPVSAFLCYIRFIKPFTELCIQKTNRKQVIAKLAEDIVIKNELTNFIPVRMDQNDNAEVIAIPVKGHGSGDFSILTDADAFIELPAGREIYQKGETYTVYSFRA